MGGNLTGHRQNELQMAACSTTITGSPWFSPYSIFLVLYIQHYCIQLPRVIPPTCNFSGKKKGKKKIREHNFTCSKYGFKIALSISLVSNHMYKKIVHAPFKTTNFPKVRLILSGSHRYGCVTHLKSFF